MKLGGVLFVACVCVVGSFSALAQQEKRAIATFRWLDEKMDSEVLAVLRKEFQDELTPNNEFKFRSLRRAGLFGSSAIVLIEAGDDVDVKGQAPFDHFSAAYNFDFSRGKKTAISSTDMLWKWTFLKLSWFESGPAPDIVFTYWNCTACEAEHSLGSFQYETESKAWTVRQWGKDEKGMTRDWIFVGSNTQTGDFIFRYATLFKVQDFDGDHFDDVLVWSREKAYEWEDQKKLHSVKDTFVVFSIKAGMVRQLEPQDLERKKLQALLCAGNKQHELCRTAKHAAITR